MHQMPETGNQTQDNHYTMHMLYQLSHPATERKGGLILGRKSHSFTRPRIIPDIVLFEDSISQSNF